MHRAAPGAELTDLRAAGEAVGDDDGVRRAALDRWNQHAAADRFRHLEMFAIVTECARHAAAARVEHFELEPVDAREERGFGCESRQRLLMAMAVNQGGG